MKSNLFVHFAVIATTAFLANTSTAQNTFYVDPFNGNMSGDGSSAKPWSTLEAVFAKNLIESYDSGGGQHTGSYVTKNSGAPIKAGDTIKLRSGDHGSVLARAYFNTDTISIEADAGHSPQLSKFHLQGGSHWRLSGLTISPEFAGTPNKGKIVHLESHGYQGPASNVIIENSKVYSVSDITGWSASDWGNQAGTGIHADGTHFVIRNNEVKNVSFGMYLYGDDILAEKNTIENYSADGMRGGGDRVTFQYNTIKWSYEVDANHDDSIQFFRPGGSDDIVLRGNLILGYKDAARPLTHGPQGIGIFDGTHDNWLVENNVVMVANHHGISICNATNSLIINNTVLDISGETESWILLKDSTDCVIRNNLASDFKTIGDGEVGLDHNLKLTDDNLKMIFRDTQTGDLSLVEMSQAIDAGSDDRAPATDINGKERPSGQGVDLGAYEGVGTP